MASTTLISISLFLFEFIVISSSSLGYARYTNNYTPSRTTAVSSKKQEANSSVVGKEFKFPSLPASYAKIEDLTRHAGYINLPNAPGSRMFYYFFKSRNSKDDPVVIWLIGGPGANSAVSIFKGNGPFRIEERNPDRLYLTWNDYGWDRVSNIIYVDQPIGTGLSYSTSDDNGIRHDQIGISNDLYDFLQEFFKLEQYRNFANNDFFITGESYAGHYAPALASRIYEGNKHEDVIPIKLKGFAVGNGMSDLKIQYPSIPEYAESEKKITMENYTEIKKLIPDCEKDIDDCRTNDDATVCVKAYESCDKIYQNTLAMGNFDSKDIRKPFGASRDFSTLESFMNAQSVKDALGVPDREFVRLSVPVYDALKRDWARNSVVEIQNLLNKGMKVLIYAGDKDLICNYIGISRWVNDMEWDDKQAFLDSEAVTFEVEGSDAGLMTSYGPLTFIKVYRAGHNVPGDQSKVALNMIKRWMEGQLK